MFELRDYQKESVNLALDYIKGNKNKAKPIIVAPTGAGKSLYIANIIKDSGKKTIVLQPNVELLRQNYEKYVGYGFEASIFSDSAGEKVLSDVVFATIKSIISAIDKVMSIGYELVLIDECHYMSKKGSQIDQFLKMLEIKKVIGLTATPIAPYNSTTTGSSLVMINRTRSNLFTEILHVTQIQELVKKGFWVDIDYKEEPVYTRKLKLNGVRSEFTDKSLIEFYNDNSLTRRIKEVISHTDSKHNLIFVPSIANAVELSKKIDSCAALYSGMPKKERNTIVEGFKNGEIKNVVNCNILSIGFNFPELDHIIMARPTNSFAVYYQQLGRGVRVSPGKQKLILTDLAKNVERFGPLENITFEKDTRDRWGMFNSDKVKGKKIQLTLHRVDFNEVLEYDNTMLWGEYKGKDLSVVPRGLLEWSADKYTGRGETGKKFVAACRAELERRASIKNKEYA